MAISASKFVKITSDFSGGLNARRDFSGLVITDAACKEGDFKDKYDAGEIVAVDSQAYGDLFAEGTDEYAWAQHYFSYVSKSGTLPSRLKFMKAKANETPAESIRRAIEGGTEDFGTFTFLCEATVPQLREAAMYNAGLNVQYRMVVDAPLDGYEDYVSKDGTSAATASVLKRPAGWSADPTVDATSFGTKVGGKSGSYAFKAKVEDGDTTWWFNGEEVQISEYFTVPSGVTVADGDEVGIWYEAAGSGILYGIPGLTLTIEASPLTMARLAATDYESIGAAGCDMFKSCYGMNATVTNDAKSDELDGLRVNYVGRVKSHGVSWNWYMRGFNMDGTDTAVYDNEMWLKSAIVETLLNLEDSLEKIPANIDGVAFVVNAVQPVLNMALDNGTILVGKTLNAEERIRALQLLGGDGGLLDTLLSDGSVLSVRIEEVSAGEYVIKYRLVYLKGDGVRKIEGAHTII